MVGCLNCEVRIETTRDTAVQCDGCKGSLHVACTGLSKDDYSRVTRYKTRAIKIMCNKCNSNLDQLLNIKGIIKAETTKLLEKITELETKLADISLAKNNVSVNFSTSQFEDIITEVNERNIRKRNIIIFNLDEPSSNLNKEQRSQYEKSNITKLLSAVSTENTLTYLGYHRLGKYALNNTRPRPLKVTLENENDVLKIIKNTNNIKQINDFKNVSISFDKTPRQISFYQELRRQLTERQMNGETNLTIRYIQGVPKIITSKN